MGGASAPLWVTIMLGGLAVAGTILGAWGGQWIAARRDDKRWARDQEREDVRWRRERQREHEKQEHETRLKWQEVRLETYAEMFSVLSAWTHESGRRTVMLKAESPDLPWQDFEHADRFDLALERVRLVGSPEVIESLEILWIDMRSVARSRAGCRETTDLVDIARAAMRTELGVLRPSSPSLPSGPTS